MSSIPPAQTIMPGLHLKRGAGEAWSLEADNIDVLVSALGEPLTVAFLRCFGAADRLMTMLECMGNVLSAGPQISSAREKRNVQTIGYFITGLVYELREGVRGLADAGIEARLTVNGRTWWDVLSVLAHPKYERQAAQIRHYLAFHLGRPDVFGRGIAALRASGESTTLIEADGRRRVDVFRPTATETIAQGMEIETDASVAAWTAYTEEKSKAKAENRQPTISKPDPEHVYRAMTPADFQGVLTEGKAGHDAQLRALDVVFLDALRGAGANLDPVAPYMAKEEDV